MINLCRFACQRFSIIILKLICNRIIDIRKENVFVLNCSQKISVIAVNVITTIVLTFLNLFLLMLLFFLDGAWLINQGIKDTIMPKIKNNRKIFPTSSILLPPLINNYCVAYFFMLNS